MFLLRSSTHINPAIVAVLRHASPFALCGRRLLSSILALVEANDQARVAVLAQHCAEAARSRQQRLLTGRGFWLVVFPWGKTNVFSGKTMGKLQMLMRK